MTFDEKAQFVSFVAEAGEVDTTTLSARVEQAHLLVELCDDGRLIGTAALKNPDAAYRMRVFKTAGVNKDPAAFVFELGWIVVHFEYRRQGHGASLVAASIEAVTSEPVYATTKNEGMKPILIANGFSPEGNPYQSKLDSEGVITLYCRS
jgi:predicted GNAT family N-acyltransferase